MMQQAIVFVGHYLGLIEQGPRAAPCFRPPRRQSIAEDVLEAIQDSMDGPEDCFLHLDAYTQPRQSEHELFVTSSLSIHSN